ncbi:carbohydrate binding domain-containing protein [Paenibacillus koleovorans]|uniref:carbohydrate binding domain-containing protein n=1 Tax=Paenibacillus koleovorans TaxID=121608 RepID=UPI000FD774F2|nr:carbohydrate binding domain-containing protein [Paenibacillus koleovorans]
MIKKFLGIWVLAAMLAALFGVQSAGAADKLVTNFSFENGLTGWSTWGGTGAASSSTTQKHSGSYSAKIVDNSSTVQYGLESAKIPITPSTIYMIYAWAYIESGSADLYIRFYDSSQTYISTAFVSKNSPTNEWTYLKVKTTAPSNAAYATALVYSNAANTGTTYWDDIYFTAAFTDLGEQVYGEAQLHSAVFGVDGSGNGVIYAVADGSTSNPTGVPARMTIVDYNNNTVVTSKPLNGSGVAWAAIKATDNKIYMGAPNTGRLYQYTPGAANVVDLGVALSGQNHIYALAAGTGGKVYGGTAPNAKFFKWDSVNGFFEIQASNPVAAGETYVRSMAYDMVNNVTYLGTGTDGKLIYFDNDTGNRYNILPSAYNSETFVYSLDYTGGKVFAQLRESNKMVVLNVVHNTGAAPTVTLDKEISTVHSLGVSNAVNNKVYYTADGILHVYDIVAKTTASLGFNLGTNAVADIGVVQLTNQTNWPGYSVVTLGYVAGEMKLFKYNIQTGATSTTVLDFPDTSTSIRSMTEGPDGKIYTAGYLTGGLGVYTPIRGDLNETKFGFGQAEHMISYNGKLYQGVYPGARIYDYNPATGVKNLLFELSADEQDRPFGLAAGDGKLFVGTVPGYGHLGGALTVYDIATGSRTTIRNIVNDQAVIALAYHNGYVYGGTSIWGGNGSTPTTSQAKFFRYNVATGAVNTYTLPGVGSSEIQAITSVSLDSNGKILFWAEGYLMKYDPSTNTVTNKGQKYSINYTVGQQSFVFFDGHMLIGKGDNLYGTIGGKLFVIDKTNDAVSTITTPVSASGIAQDVFGNLYFKNADNLWRYAF